MIQYVFLTSYMPEQNRTVLPFSICLWEIENGRTETRGGDGKSPDYKMVRLTRLPNPWKIL